MTEIRAPSEEQRDQVANVMRVSFNSERSLMEHRAPKLPLERLRCVFHGDRVLAVAADRDHRQRFGGRDVTMSGIWGVATLPEHRGAGLATGAVGQLLREARERGCSLSALYPAILRPYRGLGFELGGTYTEHEVRLDDLPRGAGGPLPIEEYEPERDLEGVRACYRQATEHGNGPIDSDDPDWWPDKIMGGRPDEHHRAVVARGPDGGIEGYASFVHEKDESGDLDVSFRLGCRHLIASSIAGTASLFGYFRGFRGLGQALRFTGPPADPLAMLVEEQRVRPAFTFRWMLRLLDVRSALKTRGYPPVSGEAVLAVEDAQFPDNRGPWRVTASDGSIEVEPADGARVRPIPVGALSSMLSGFLSPFDAARLGLLERDDEVLPFLARLFSGPAPFMYEFF